MSFTVGDINRLPVFPVADADFVFARLESAFSIHEAHREPSVEFKKPGSSPWRYAQCWAQDAVDRTDGIPLRTYMQEFDPEPATDHLGFALGIAIGRFDANGLGILNPVTDNMAQALSDGILFLDLTLDDGDTRDSIGHPAAASLHEAWASYHTFIGTKRKSLREWLALDFFKDVHKGMYENRPIYWPLSSTNKTFVAWVNVHRMTERTLRILMADHLQPAMSRLEGTLHDLRAAREEKDKKAAREAESQYRARRQIA